jgi:hypothetical protein
MDQWQTTLIASFVGAAVGSIFSIAGMVVNSWLTLSRERRQLAWKKEVDRIIELEERVGSLVEIATSYRGIEEIIERTRDDYRQLEVDAGRFKRYKGIMQSLRDLHNGVGRLLDSQAHHEDWREVAVEVDSIYDSLLKECDAVTGKRRL